MKIDNQCKSDSKSCILLILILLIGLIVRLFTFSQVFEPGRIVFLEADPYYHMWRVFSYIDTFPNIFFFDGYINYPYGVLVGWPPLFDLMTAFISIILGLGKPGIYLVETIGACMPVILGIFSIISGIMIGLSFITWIGAPIFIGILLSYIVIQFILDKRSNVNSNYLLNAGAISFSMAFFTIIFFYLWMPWQKDC